MNGLSRKQASSMAARTIRPWPAALLRRPGRLGQESRRVWAILRLAVKKFLRIDGAQWAGAFAFNAFFSLFPLCVLFVTIAPAFIDQDRAGKEIITYMESYVPMSGAMQSHIFDTIAGVVKARVQAVAVAFFFLVWVGVKCFTTIILATNRAWGTTVNNWWRLPLKSLLLLGITAGTVLLGIAVPMLMRMAQRWLFTASQFHSWVYAPGSFFISLLVVFLSLSLFYGLAPRQPKRFAEVWVVALFTMALLQGAERLFEIYLKNFAPSNMVYGAFGGIMALLLWIYISGCIFIFGACLCAAQAEGRLAPAGAILADRTQGS